MEVRAGAVVSFPIRGVLLAGGFRTQHQINTMSRDDMRNTLIVELAAQTGRNLQGRSNLGLALTALGVERF